MVHPMPRCGTQSAADGSSVMRLSSGLSAHCVSLGEIIVKATNLLATGSLALAAIAIVALSVSYPTSREPGSRSRHAAVTVPSTSAIYPQRGQRTRLLAANQPDVANSGRIRHSPDQLLVALDER